MAIAILRQGFANSGKGLGEGNRKFYWATFFFTRRREPEEELFWRFEPFSKLKTAFHECWTSLKSKLTFVSTEYESKTKMEQEQWLQLKVLFLLGYNQLLFSGGIVFWWWGGGGGGGGGGVLVGFFLGGGGMIKFSTSGVGLPPSFSTRENPVRYPVTV